MAALNGLRIYNRAGTLIFIDTNGNFSTSTTIGYVLNQSRNSSGSVTALSDSAGGDALDASTTLGTIVDDLGNVYLYDATPITDFTLLRVIHNGCCYEVGGGTTGPYVDALIVGGGGGGGGGGYCYSYYAGGGGGAGGLVLCRGLPLKKYHSYCVVVGEGGAGGAADGSTISCQGGASCLGEYIAYGGGRGGDGKTPAGGDGGSGGGGSRTCGGAGCTGQGNAGGGSTTRAGSGGGGAGGPGCGGGGDMCDLGHGGVGISSDISGASVTYATGGNGGDCNHAYGDASGYGDGGGGGRYDQGYGYCWCGGKGGNGIVIIRYPTARKNNIKNATGGCKYTCGDYTIHCFTSNGTFCIVS